MGRRPEPNDKLAETSGTYQAVELVLLLSGIVGNLIGLFHLFLILADGYSPARLGDMFINGTMGMVALVSWRLLKARRSAVILLFFGGIALSLAYGFAAGRGFNFISAGFGAIILLQLVIFKRSRELG